MPKKAESRKVIKKPSSQELTSFTQAEREAARYMAGLFTMTKVMQAVAIAWFCGEEKYYRILGYQTEQEFMEMFAGKGRIQGHKYKEIGSAYLKSYPIAIPDEVFPEVEKSKGRNDQLLINSTHLIPLKTSEMQKFATFIEKIGIEKFYSLTQYDVNFKELLDGEAVVLKNGERIPVQDVIATSNRDLLARIDELEGRLSDKKRELTETRSKLEEKAKMAESERDRLRGIEEKYGPKAVEFEQKLRYFEQGRDAHRDSLMYLVKCNIEEDDGEKLIGDMAGLLKEWDEDLKRLRDLYSHAILAVTP